jgi:hypothetical protein
MPVVVSANMAESQVCSNPAGCVSGGTLGAVGRAPQGSRYMPPGGRPNAFVGSTTSWFYQGNSTYHALNASLIKRVSYGLTFKANYTFGKILDLNSALNANNGGNEPQNILDIHYLPLNRGVAAYSVQQQFNTNFSYELPFGRGKRWGSASGGVVDTLINGWQWNGILTAQSGFPFTPQAGSNRSGTGDASNSDVPNRNPAFAGPVILGRPEQWFNSNAFLLPTAGTFGNVARGSFIGPSLTTFDTSLFKKFAVSERLSLQLRAEAFNMLNHSTFASPNPIVFSGSNISASAGVITKTAATSRQTQFALKLLF